MSKKIQSAELPNILWVSTGDERFGEPGEVYSTAVKDTTRYVKMSFHNRQMKELKKQIHELEFNAEEVERLKRLLNDIIHPAGDGPENPNFADLCHYVQAEMKIQERALKTLEKFRIELLEEHEL